MLYSYKKDFPEKSNKNYLDSLNFNDLMKQSEELGPFYTSPFWLTYQRGLYLILFAILCISLFFNFNYWFNWRKLKFKLSVSGVLSSEALVFLEECLKFPKHHTFTSNEITKLMGYDNQAYDTQRQYRSKLIHHINDHFKNNYNIPLVIIRINSNSDKRFVDYTISPDYFERVKELLNM